ncbi:MAG: hypothetical protein P4L53_17870 [Candidatus Obscuribacterales bacterium]|nr:hypothetical protein [Candidatus Obscuribacterales bacterium]
MRIHNSHKTIPVALALAAIFSTASTRTALASGFSTDTSKLPDASKIQRSRLKVQIVDESPEVTDTRKRQNNTLYQINVPPLPQSTTNVVQIGDPAAGAGNRAGNSNTIPILQNSLPFAGPTSNIAPHQLSTNQLPKGFSTQGLNGTLAGKKQAQSTPMAQSSSMTKPLAAARPTPTATYGPTTPSTSVNQSKSANTNVIGALLHPKKEK